MIILGLILARSAGASVAAAITGDHPRALRYLAVCRALSRQTGAAPPTTPDRL